MTLRLSTLMVLGAAFLLASAAQAQVRPSESVYILLRGGVTGYYGDRDGATDDDDFADDLLDGFDARGLVGESPGFSVGGEIGYLFNENLSFGIGAMYNKLPELDGLDGLNTPVTNENFIANGRVISRNVNDEAYYATALFRYIPFAKAVISPYVELGGAFVYGVGSQCEQTPGADCNSTQYGYGPVGGLGLDVALSPQFGLFLGSQATLVFPDAALDGTNPSAYGVAADETAFDMTLNVGGGLRYALRAPGTAVMIEGLECPAELETGETGTFTVFTNADATAPVSAMWQFGDGESGSGATVRNAYSAPGTYTVTAMAMNGFGETSESCLVTVVDPPIPAPTLAGCRATPTQVVAGESVSISATATGADEISVDFGDGTTASTLPARHTYAAAGSYTVEIMASNASGSDMCRVPVTVVDPTDAFCADITELNPVFFGYGSTTLSADARARLDENIEVLRRCPSIDVTINGYSDGSEPGDAQRISEARAEAVRAYYVGQGLDASRFEAIGRGVAPGANAKEDPGPGDARARRADSIPSSR